MSKINRNKYVCVSYATSVFNQIDWLRICFNWIGSKIKYQIYIWIKYDALKGTDSLYVFYVWVCSLQKNEFIYIA